MDTIELDKGTDSVLILVAASVYVCALGEHSTPPPPPNTSPASAREHRDVPMHTQDVPTAPRRRK